MGCGLKSFGGPWYVLLLSFLLKSMNLHIHSNWPIEITELKTGVARTEFLEKQDLCVIF
jgi:hypothetical protein